MLLNQSLLIGIELNYEVQELGMAGPAGGALFANMRRLPGEYLYSDPKESVECSEFAIISANFVRRSWYFNLMIARSDLTSAKRSKQRWRGLKIETLDCHTVTFFEYTQRFGPIKALLVDSTNFDMITLSEDGKEWIASEWIEP